MFLAPLLVFLDTVEKTLNSDDDPPPVGGELPPWRARNNVVHYFTNTTTCTGRLNEDHDRYARWAARPGNIGEEIITRLRCIDVGSYSSLSIGPLITFDRAVEPTRPFLHYFEDLLFFRYLVVQLCLWALFATFWAVFADFEQFWPITQTYTPASWLQDIITWDVRSDQSPTANVYILIFWILFLGPSTSVLFVLFWRWSPNRIYEPRPALRIVVFGLRLVFSLSFLLLPTLTFIYLEVKQAAFAWGMVVLAYVSVCVGLSALNDIPEPGELPVIPNTV